jgi:hypothetical protein
MKKLGIEVWLLGVLVIVVESMDGVSPNEAQELDGPSVPWRPRQLAFGHYRQESEPAKKGQTLRVVVRSPVSLLFVCFCLSGLCWWLDSFCCCFMWVLVCMLNYEHFGFDGSKKIRFCIEWMIARYTSVHVLNWDVSNCLRFCIWHYKIETESCEGVMAAVHGICLCCPWDYQLKGRCLFC